MLSVFKSSLVQASESFLISLDFLTLNVLYPSEVSVCANFKLLTYFELGS